jgi:hypothetical protein
MKLPSVEAAVVPDEKITGYLLSPTSGRASQGGVLRRLRLTGEAGQALAAALVSAADHEVAKVESTPFGTRYVVEGTIETPNGRTPSIRSVWFLKPVKTYHVLLQPIHSKEQTDD